jgi:hypothetical protein
LGIFGEMTQVDDGQCDTLRTKHLAHQSALTLTHSAPNIWHTKVLFWRDLLDVPVPGKDEDENDPAVVQQAIDAAVYTHRRSIPSRCGHAPSGCAFSPRGRGSVDPRLRLRGSFQGGGAFLCWRGF